MAPLPSRLSGTTGFPAARTPAPGPVTYEAVRQRVLARLHDRLDPAKVRRTPDSLLRPDVRRLAEQLVDAEHPAMNRAERDMLVDDVVGDTLGFGPLDDLFRDPTVREVMVLGPALVVARRDGGWVPTNSKFRDANHLRVTLDKVVGQAEPVPGERLPSSALDARLPNGFRVVGVLPPLALEHPPALLFVRADSPPPAVAAGWSAPGASAGSASAGVRPSPPGLSGRVAAPSPRSSAHDSANAADSPLNRLRERITERIITKLSGLGVYDLSRVDGRELQKVVGAYIHEVCEADKYYLSEADQTKLAHDILTAIRR